MIALVLALIFHILALVGPANQLIVTAVPGDAPAAVQAQHKAREPIVPSLPAGVRIEHPGRLCWLDWCPYAGRSDERNVAGLYFAGSRVGVVVYEDWNTPTTAHELCHAHQQWTIERLSGPLPDDDRKAINMLRDLWPQTPEGKAWGGDLESFAEACAWGWLQPERLSQATYDLLRRIVR